MAKASTVWGIDVGQCALKAVKLHRAGEDVTVEAFDIIEHEKNRQWKASAHDRLAASCDAPCPATRRPCAKTVPRPLWPVLASVANRRRTAEADSRRDPLPSSCAAGP